MALDPITAVSNVASRVLDAVLPDPTARREAQFRMAELISTGAMAQFAEQASIVRAEAQSESWLTSNWRPVVMLTFAALIVARMLGFTAPGLSEAEVLKLWSILEVGIGGYVIGRSAEKILPEVAKALGNRPR